ncbi:AAA family ATPase [Sulfurisphaera ohwakuensis]|uniref:AAA family ATPase n=1 Tax=Sulfurisphaera ohwakuensis TaxID=69656 RepID=A0A650CGD4_SULOH|nr:AAA family ATPase [Sulfurisphaera ohwakuensis]MBB5254210.1 putative ATPase [Sulfurisphaera ohwakuensis]QGR16808.1 AAA family ATPase [Sulfurisphaera ohwakuensis]
MKVIIKNFGPINDAEFELGDITIVIGPNASGKSFISLLLYSIFGARPIPSPKDLEQPVKDEMSLSSYLDTINKVLSRTLRRGLERVFGVDYKELITVGNQESKISFVNKIGSLDIILGEEFKVVTKLNKDIKIFMSFTESKDMPFGSISARVHAADDNYTINVHYGTDFPKSLRDKFNELLEIQKRRVLASILSEIVINLFFDDFRPVIVLPTERNLAVSNLIGYISTYISIDKLSKISDKPVIRYFIRSLLNAMRILRNKEFSINTINLKYKIVEPFVLEVYEKDKKIPLSLLSSGYAQILPIDILSRFGKFIIIEEPELNLHAGAQVSMANYLYNLITEGKKLFLTTHSDIFTIQMTINHVKKNNSEKLKIYLLNRGTMEEIEYTEKGDIESIPTITDVIREQVKEIYGE